MLRFIVFIGFVISLTSAQTETHLKQKRRLDIALVIDFQSMNDMKGSSSAFALAEFLAPMVTEWKYAGKTGKTHIAIATLTGTNDKIEMENSLRESSDQKMIVFQKKAHNFKTFDRVKARNMPEMVEWINQNIFNKPGDQPFPNVILWIGVMPNVSDWNSIATKASEELLKAGVDVAVIASNYSDSKAPTVLNVNSNVEKVKLDPSGGVKMIDAITAKLMSCNSTQSPSQCYYDERKNCNQQTIYTPPNPDNKYCARGAGRPKVDCKLLSECARLCNDQGYELTPCSVTCGRGQRQNQTKMPADATNKVYYENCPSVTVDCELEPCPMDAWTVDTRNTTLYTTGSHATTDPTKSSTVFIGVVAGFLAALIVAVIVLIIYCCIRKGKKQEPEMHAPTKGSLKPKPQSDIAPPPPLPKSQRSMVKKRAATSKSMTAPTPAAITAIPTTATPTPTQASTPTITPSTTESTISPKTPHYVDISTRSKSMVGGYVMMDNKKSLSRMVDAKGSRKMEAGKPNQSKSERPYLEVMPKTAVSISKKD